MTGYKDTRISLEESTHVTILTDSLISNERLPEGRTPESKLAGRVENECGSLEWKMPEVRGVKLGNRSRLLDI